MYNAAGEIWQRGRVFAHARGMDDAITHTAMIRAVAKVSRRLFTSFRRCLLDEIKNRKSSTVARLEDLEAVADESSSESLAEQIEKKILLEEIVSHMDDRTRFIYERLILGYSFEEIAETLGTKSNVLRSRFSKSMSRIRSQFADVSSTIEIG